MLFNRMRRWWVGYVDVTELENGGFRLSYKLGSKNSIWVRLLASGARHPLVNTVVSAVIGAIVAFALSSWLQWN